MKLQYVKVLAHTEVNKDVFVAMKCLEGALHVLECRIVVDSVLSEINEVQNGPESDDHLLRYLAY